MVFSLNYRRPARVPVKAETPLDEKRHSFVTQKSDNGSCSTCVRGIPDALSFDRIISGGVCPPCTVRDFMNYLRYIEHDAEHLQFFLWYRDYSARFSTLSASEQVLSPEWTVAQADALAQQNTATATEGHRQRVNPAVADALKGTDFESKPDAFGSQGEKESFVSERRITPGSPKDSDYDSSLGEKTYSSSQALSALAGETYESAGLKWQPCQSPPTPHHPFRQEVSRIVAIYLSNDGPRRLNISETERAAVLHALQTTTHPSAFRSIIGVVESTLRNQSHPNFIRWTICNGNTSRVIFARGLGIFGILAGLIASILLVLSHAGRGWRVLPIIGFLVGISTLIAAWKGMCVVLHGMHHRHLRPWELFADDESIETKDMSQESLLSNTSNSYEDEPWIARYEKRNVVRKVFDREIWVKEPALRQIQDTIFIQAILGALVLSCVLTGIFCAVPHGNFF